MHKLDSITPRQIRAAADFISPALAQNWIYRLGTRILPAVMSIFKRADGWMRSVPYPLSRWTKGRPLPPFTAHFRQWWAVRSAKRKDQNR
ncbi:MAG: hypothetical protein AB8I58_19335 [Anaerolineales bacterium]|jgi:hypothetical protein